MAEAEAPVQEQQRIASLAEEGVMLVDAALGYGHEGAISTSVLQTASHAVYEYSLSTLDPLQQDTSNNIV